MEGDRSAGRLVVGIDGSRSSLRALPGRRRVMSNVDLQMLRDLSFWQTPPCVTIYLRTDPTQPRVLVASRTTLETMIGEVQHQLQTVTPLRRTAIDELLAPAQALLDTEPWPVGYRGYGLFSAPGFSIEAQLDVDVPTLSVVGDRFVTTPLVAALPTHGRFYVLAISHQRVRLLGGHRHGLADVPVPDLAASRADALRHEDLLSFFRVVDRALWRVLHAQTAPLFVVGVAEELAVYRRANDYTHLAGTVDVDKPERLSLHELHDKVWPIASRTLDRLRRVLIDQADTSRTLLTAIPAILTARHHGRVAALLVQPDRLQWGTADAAELHSDRRPGDIELVTTAIGAALRHGAAVHPAGPDELPGDTPVAAIVLH